MDTKSKIKDLIPDNKNYNKGTEFGNSLIDKSLSRYGAGRSILIDKNNRIIAGNKTIENASAMGLEDLIIVETTGDRIVAVKRTDIDLDSEEGRGMALADNASAKASISWDMETLGEDWEVEQLSEWGVELEDMPDVLEAEEKESLLIEVRMESSKELESLYGDLISKGYDAVKK